MGTTTGTPLTQGIGATLRHERERRRLSIDAVSRGTLVRAPYLELIDQDRFEDLPPGAYTKGFLRSYAGYLGLDPVPLVRAYEGRYEQPAPELSRVVRRGIRVPPDAHRRTWKIAAGLAASILVLLGIFGVFRSDGETDGVTEIAVAAVRSLPTAAPNPMGTAVRVEVVGEASWIEVKADDEVIFAATLERGESRTFKGTDRVEVFAARARDVRIFANGQEVGVPDHDSYRGVFTPSTDQLPPNQIAGD